MRNGCEQSVAVGCPGVIPHPVPVRQRQSVFRLTAQIQNADLLWGTSVAMRDPSGQITKLKPFALSTLGSGDLASAASNGIKAIENQLALFPHSQNTRTGNWVGQSKPFCTLGPNSSTCSDDPPEAGSSIRRKGSGTDQGNGPSPSRASRRRPDLAGRSRRPPVMTSGSAAFRSSSCLKI